MEALLQRKLPDVRIHTSPAVEELGAEALTTGRQIVFAPGRFAPASRDGIRLLGHELAHIGQPLAFKRRRQEDLSGDPEERAAEKQEALVQRIIEQGWPGTGGMTYRAPATTPGRSDTPTRAGGSTTLPTFERRAIPQVQRAAMDEGIPTSPVAASDIMPVARFREEPSAAPASDQAGNLDLEALARDVYRILKRRLRAERDRHHLYGR